MQQMEQLSNALAIEQLGYATVTREVTAQHVADWLAQDSFVRINYPDVHERIADWLVGGRRTSIEALSQSLWEKVTVERGSVAAQAETCAGS